MAKHSNYIKKNNEAFSDDEICSILSNTLYKVILSVKDEIKKKKGLSCQDKDSCYTINDFIVNLIKLDSLTEETNKRIFSFTYSNFMANTKIYAEILFKNHNKYKFDIEPFVVLRTLRNKFVHVVDPIISARTFLKNNKNKSLQFFLDDLEKNSTKLISTMQEIIKEKNRFNIEEKEHIREHDNTYRLKL